MRHFAIFLFWIISWPTAGADLPKAPLNTAFVANLKQWPAPVLFKADLPQGALFLEETGFTYHFAAPAYFAHPNDKATRADGRTYPAHAFRVTFRQANPHPVVAATDTAAYRRHYFLGSDAGKWARNVKAYQQVTYRQLYHGIDLQVHTGQNQLKYDYILAPQANPDLIKMQYEGGVSLAIEKGRLRIRTSVNEINEDPPYAYQLINGQRKQIPCVFTLHEQTVGFKLTGAYNKNIPLIIDPNLVFASYSGGIGGLSANCTAADSQGNMYAAGYAIGLEYPISLGAYQIVRQGNNVIIFKFNDQGTALLYATFLGGNNGEYPFALTVNRQDELVILGNTNSTTFPTTAGAYNRNLNGINYDYFLARLSANGTILLAATLFGGSASEAGALANVPSGVTLDASGNIYVGGSSNSNNFPVVDGFQKQSSFGYDGVVAKFNASLSNLLWSTYLGGTNEDVISGIKVGASGKVYVAGFTNSPDLPATANAVQPKPLGARDGFAAVISANGSQLQACTYLGTNQPDFLRFLELDTDENVYVCGYTQGAYPVTKNTYHTPDAVRGYFVHKLNSALTSTIFSTHLGAAERFDELTPTAFKVDACENIYLSGYAFPGILPVTTDAFEPNPRSIYLCQLSRNAQNLVYGTFIGSANFNLNHVHPANQSTFTNQGFLYHIECTIDVDYPVTNQAFSLKQTNNYDAALFKFQFDQTGNMSLNAAINSPVAAGCVPYQVNFTHNSTGALTYSWDFGDGSPPTTDENPTHTFVNPGNYRVRLIVGNPELCHRFDTTYVPVTAKLVPMAVLPKQAGYLCAGETILDAGNAGSTYLWSTGATSQSITVNEPGTYQVEISNGACSIMDSITIQPPVILQAPNIFTPNQDGKNDYFIIPNNGSDTKLKVFNRWGSLVYQSNQYQNNWDGSDLSNGTYFYTIESSGSCQLQKGWFEIIR